MPLENSHALPIDWHGVFGADSTLIDNYRRIEQTTDRSNNSNAGNRGTAEVPLGSGAKANSSFQSYVFRLNPVLIVNDSATFKGELSSGYGRGGRLGDGTTQSKEPGYGNTLYPYNFQDDDNTVLLNQFYMELYSDTATYLIGRFPSHYGLGAVVNSGENTWDRFAFIRDGIMMKLKLGNFHISPYWAKVGSQGSLTRATKIKEIGVSLVYKSMEKDLSFGILYGKKENSSFSGTLTQGTTVNIPDPTTGNFNSYSALGKADVKMTDLYFKKGFGDLDIGVEVPLMGGEMGSIFSTNTKYKAKAILFESNYKINESWVIGIDGGQVSGDDGGSNSFDAMYLNPNYQIANLLFRYNLRAISSPDGAAYQRSVYDSYITNATYLKARFKYQSEKWTWDGAFIYAKANETATSGRPAFNHETNKLFTATQSQSEDLGMEIDFGFNYEWNKEVNIGGSFGYLMAGDYYSYTNDAGIVNTADNSYALQIRTSLEF